MTTQKLVKVKENCPYKSLVWTEYAEQIVKDNPGVLSSTAQELIYAIENAEMTFDEAIKLIERGK